MSLNETRNYYDVLEISPDASAQEIRDSYLRLKAAYGKDSVAHYSLFSQEETGEMLGVIDIAYEILSNEEKRKEYDQNHGFRELSFGSEKVVPIDRRERPIERKQEEQRPNHSTDEEIKQKPANLGSDLRKEIDGEVYWRGETIRKYREIQNVSVEEVADFTKISKTYIRAIEDESFDKLPAAAYLRGFLITISKMLKLPHDRVAAAYTTRYREARAENEE